MIAELALPPPPVRTGGGPTPHPPWARRLVGPSGWLLGSLVAALVVAILALAVLPAVGGRLVVITSGSMAPAIATGDAVILLDTPAEEIGPGEVIAYHGYGRDGLVTHRVISRQDVDGELHFRTRGDANPQPDADLAPAAGMVGEVALVLPAAGWLLLALTSWWAQLGLAGAAAVVAAVEARDLLVRHGAARRRPRLPAPVRSAPPRRRGPGHGGPLSAVVLSLGCVALVHLGAAGAGLSTAVLTGSQTLADNAFATVDLVAPGNVSATFDCGTLGLGKGILVEWDSASGAEGYEVGRSTDSGGPYSTIAAVDASTTQYMDGDVENDTTYYYVVRSTASGWVSENSAEASETTPGSTDCLL